MANGSPNLPDDFEFRVDVKSVPLTPIFIKIENQSDIINVLHRYALKLKRGLIILSASGAVRKVVLPLANKTYEESVYQIMSLSGRIVPLKSGGIAGDINLVMSDVHGATVGGIVQSLVAETTVEVIVCHFYYDMSASHSSDFDPPMISGNPFMQGSSSSHQNSSKEV